MDDWLIMKLWNVSNIPIYQKISCITHYAVTLVSTLTREVSDIAFCYSIFVKAVQGFFHRQLCANYTGCASAFNAKYGTRRFRHNGDDSLNGLGKE